LAETTVHVNPNRSPIETVIDRVWRYFCSVRAAIWEISFLALLVLIGTLRGSEVPAWIGSGLPALQPVVDRWYDWDVFRSPVFAVILALLSVAIAVCTINRVPGIWQTISHPRVSTSQGYLRGAETSASFATTSTVEQVTAVYLGVLARRRFRVLTERIGSETHIYSDKNRYAKLGTFPFHLALILLLVGGIVGAHYGFREREFIIPVGETRPVGHGTDLRVQLVQFQDSYTPLGIANTYEAEIVIYDGDEPVRHGTISPNSPISYRTATFYQTSFGYGASMRVTDPSGTVLYDETVNLGIFNFRGNPDAPAGFDDIRGADVRMTVVAPDTQPQNAPDLDTLNLLHGQMYVILKPNDGSTTEPQGIIIDQGQPVQIGDLTFEFQREVQWSLLQVAYNPGIPIFIIASVLLIGGLVFTFYFPLRRIRAIVSEGPQGAILTAVPLAKRDWSGKREFFRTIDAVAETLGVEPSRKKPAGIADWERLPVDRSAG